MLPPINRGLQAKSIHLQVFNSSRDYSYQRTERSPQQYSRSTSAKQKQQRQVIGTLNGKPENNSHLRSYQHDINDRNKNIRLATEPSKKYSQQIREIDRRIRQCKRKLQKQKRDKILEKARLQSNSYQQNFERILKKQVEFELNRQYPDVSKQFDYLTNPLGKNYQQEGVPQEQPNQVAKVFSIDQGMQKLQRFYQKSLKKKFQRREVIPHKAWKRKAPKLYITHKTNAVSKHGKAQSEQQHKFRVLTKQITPQQIYTAIPSFGVVKDNLSRNIVAYLGQYKPFIDKTRDKMERDGKKREPVIENSEIAIKN